MAKARDVTVEYYPVRTSKSDKEYTVALSFDEGRGKQKVTTVMWITIDSAKKLQQQLKDLLT